jgi:hypothetical protein
MVIFQSQAIHADEFWFVNIEKLFSVYQNYQEFITMEMIAASYANSDSEDDADPLAGTGVSTKRPHSCDDNRPSKRQQNQISNR